MAHVEYLAILFAGCASLALVDVRYVGVWRRWRRLLAVVAVNFERNRAQTNVRREQS